MTLLGVAAVPLGVLGYQLTLLEGSHASPPLIAHSTHDEAPTAISVHPHETAMTCNVCFAEKNLLLDFTNGRTGTFEMTDCTFGGGRRRHLSQEKGYWTWGVEGVSQWTAFRPTCTFSGVECYEDGHVRSMCAP